VVSNSVVPSSIEREVLIQAPVEFVWSIVTEPQHITRWLSESAEIDLRPGGEMLLGFGRVGTARGTVERVESPHSFAFRWVTPEPDRDLSAHPVNSTLVEFLLRAEGDDTLLRVVESGFASLDGTEQENANLAVRHRGGWGTFLDQLAGYVSTANVSA
jgi:uncharacterized protein YndB with AHSA1/START domain